ncbi:MAG: hypothetical protein K5756_01215 [Clostridiales bacterium]|nr:hypothetical protein [Clostridiales bacterium]
MKKQTRIISILMAFVMLVSGLSVGVNAAYTAYNKPGGYDTLGRPFLTLDQCGSAVLDKIDAMLAEKNLTYDINYLGGLIDLDLDLTSIDNAMDSIVDVLDSNVVSLATDVFNCGDVEKLDDYWLKNSPRRTTNGRTDLEVFYGLLKFLAANKTLVGKAIDGTFDLGTFQRWIKLSDLTGDIPAKIKEAVYGALFDKDKYGEMPAGMTVDQMLNKKLQYLLVYDDVDQLSGLLPSMAGKTDVNNNTAYEFLRNAINAALTDIVIPSLRDTLIEKFGIVVNEQHPNGYYDGLSDLDIVWNILFKKPESEQPAEPSGESGDESGNESGGALESLLKGLVEVPDNIQGQAIPMIEYALNYLIMGPFLDTYITRSENGLSLAGTFDESIGELLTIACNLMPLLNLNGVTLKTNEEVDAMTTSEKFSYIGKMVSIGLLDFTVIPDSVQSLREVATYVLISYCANIIPDIEYLSKINYNVQVSTSNAINPSTDGALIPLAALLTYYLNANTEMNIPEGLSFDGLVEHIVNWALNKFGGALYTGGLQQSESAWSKLDKLLFGESPLLNGIFQKNWLPTAINTNNPANSLTYDIIINRIVFAILDFDFDSLLEIFQKNPNGELNKPVLNVILNFVARIVNGMFGNEKVIPLNLPNAEAIFEASTLRGVAERLLGKLPDYIEAICTVVLPIVVPKMDIVNMKQFDITAPEGTVAVTAEQLRWYLDQQVPKSQTQEYDEDGYVFFGIEDFKPAYRYYDYMDARREAESILKKYAENPDAISLRDITNASYRLNYYYDELIRRTALNASKLNEILNIYDISDFDQSQYSVRSWNEFARAYAFANDLYEDILFGIGNFQNVTQSMISEARSQVISAVKGLKPWAPLADYEAFDDILATAKFKTSDKERTRYFEDGMTDLLSVLDKAIQLPKDYDRNEQSTIDKFVEALQEALEALVYKPAIVSVETTNAIIDSTRKLAYGLEEGLMTVLSHITKVGAGTVEVFDNGRGFQAMGTGTVVKLVLNDEVIDTYTVVIFGDVDGDGYADGNDAVIVSQLANGRIESSDLGETYALAADADGDNGVDDLDVMALIDSGMFKTTINQNHEIV